jgi:hypothetical protein
MINLKPLKYGAGLGKGDSTRVDYSDGNNPKPGLLKKKPFGKTSVAPKPIPNLLKRLTGK